MFFFTLFFFVLSELGVFDPIPLISNNVPINIYTVFDSYTFQDSQNKIFNQAYVEIFQSSFTNMQNYDFGGAIYAIFSQIFIDQSLFFQCSSAVGGSIALVLSDLTCKNTDFSKSLSYVYGGALIMSSTQKSFIGSFTENSNQEFFNDFHYSYLYECKFNDCTSLTAFGGVFLNQINSILIEKCSFTNCQSAHSGGALSLYGKYSIPNDYEDNKADLLTPIIIDTNFTNNKVSRTTKTKSFEDTSYPFIRRTGIHSTDFHTFKGGGAIYVYNYLNIYTENAQFVNNRCMHPSSNIRVLPGNDIYFVNTYIYYSYKTLLNKNDANSIAYKFKNIPDSKDLQIISRDVKYYDGNSYDTFQPTKIFTPYVVVSSNTQSFDSYPLQTEYIPQTPYATPVRRTNNGETKSAPYPTPKDFLKRINRTINPDFFATNHFSKSNQFSESNIFSESNRFTKSSQFTFSNKFVYTHSFSPSDTFTSSNYFSKSAEFTGSELLIPTMTPSQTPERQQASLSVTVSMTMVKSVTLNPSYSLVKVKSYLMTAGTYYEVISMSYVMSLNYYYVYFMSPSYVDMIVLVDSDVKGKGLSQEQLIGVVCGSVAVFFVVAGIVVIVLRKKATNIYSDVLEDFESEDSLENREETNNVSVGLGETNKTDLINANADMWL